MKKDRFLWSAHRITERQKAGKARSIKGKQLKNSRNTVSRLHVVLHSSQRDNMCYFWKFGKWLICWISRVVGVAEKCLIWVDK